MKKNQKLISFKKSLFNEKLLPVLDKLEITSKEKTEVMKTARLIAEEYADAYYASSIGESYYDSADVLFEKYHESIENDIIDMCKKLNVSSFNLVGFTRGNELISTARCIVSYNLTEKYGSSDKMFNVIGRVMGGRDRGTIRSSRNRALQLMEVKDDMFMTMFLKLNQ